VLKSKYSIKRGVKMKIKMIYSLDEKKFEKLVNEFLTDNKDKIEIVEIKWRVFIAHYAMIMYNEK
jgi:hypothetical protein